MVSWINARRSRYPELDPYKVFRVLRRCIIVSAAICCLSITVYYAVVDSMVATVTPEDDLTRPTRAAPRRDRSVWDATAFLQFLDGINLVEMDDAPTEYEYDTPMEPAEANLQQSVEDATTVQNNDSLLRTISEVISKNTVAEDPDVKVILLWNTLWKSKNFGVGALGRDAFTNNKCKVDKCTLETDRGLLNRSAAVVFHIRGRVNRFPSHTNPRQLFVYFLRESPHFTYKNSWQHRGDFNITMTYRMDSDIPVPIFRYVPEVKGSRKALTPYKLKYPLATRNGSVAWLVSHCGTPTSRGRYADTLSRFIPVDIYGACGELECKAFCMKKFEKEYKFYLSFENSFCTDYVTEKYHRALRHELIPIVYGRANYTALGPPGAFINILDYRSPKHLAKYLRYLSSNETAYAEYFTTRSSWKSVKVLGPAFCDLCELVHNGSFSRVYEDVHSWWVNGTCDMDTVRKVVNSTKIP